MVKIQTIRHLSMAVVAMIVRDGKIEERRFPVLTTDAEVEAAVLKEAKPAKAKKAAKNA